MKTKTPLLHTLTLTFALGALLALAPAAQATPETAKQKSAHIAALCKDPQTRVLLIQELTNTHERKMEVCKLLKTDPEFRSLYEAAAVNPG